MSEKKSIMDDFKEGAGEIILDQILPKIKPFFEPAAAKLTEYMGDDKHILILRSIHCMPILFVIDTTKTRFKITNEHFDVEDPENGVVGRFSLTQGLEFLLNNMK